MNQLPRLTTKSSASLESGGRLTHAFFLHTSMGESSECDTTDYSHTLNTAENFRVNHTPQAIYRPCFGLPYQDHNYGAPPPPTPPRSPSPVPQPPSPSLTSQPMSPLIIATDEEEDDTTVSLPDISSSSSAVVSTAAPDEEDEVMVTTTKGNSCVGEENTVCLPAPEVGEEDSITRCICDFQHDDGYMICCDKCFVWQHVDCMGLDRSSIPDVYLCELCEPRRVDKQRARSLQIRKRDDLFSNSSDSDSGHCREVKKKTVAKKNMKKKPEPKKEKKKKKKVLKCDKGHDEKKELCKKRPLRKSQRRMSHSEETEDKSQILRRWIDDYEEAVTNHYSPELRARIGTLRVNGVHDDFKSSIHGPTKCKVSELPSGVECLVASCHVSVNNAIIEYRGKYLLASQFRQQNPTQAKTHHSHLLYYQFPKDGPSVCVDARKYGNNARFIRRSCKPNSEIKHLVEKGSLHLYIVATSSIAKDAEITIPHDRRDYVEGAPCACGSSSCQGKPAPVTKKNGVTQDIGAKLRRRSCRSVSTESAESMENMDTGSKKASPKGSPAKVRERKDTTDSETETDHKKKLTREERKMEAIIRAFERMEKMELRRQEAQLKTQHHHVKKEEPSMESHTSEPIVSSPVKSIEIKEEVEEEVIVAPKEEGGDKRLVQKKEKEQEEEEKKTVAQEESECEKPPVSRGADVGSSADEELPHKPVAERTRRRGKKRTRSVASSPVKRRTRMDSGGSDLTSPDDSSAVTTPLSSWGSSGSDVTSPQTPLSSAVVVTPLSAPVVSSQGFKFPKTKKILMNEWLSETVDHVVQVAQPLSVRTECPEVPTCYVRSAKSPTGIPRRASLSVVGPPTGAMSVGSAKKRWLRQAISEEEEITLVNGCCSSPNSGPGSRPGSPVSAVDYVTPLKKRRLARESMSSEQSFTPPSTPSGGTAAAMTLKDAADEEETPACDAVVTENEAKVKTEDCRESVVVNNAACAAVVSDTDTPYDSETAETKPSGENPLVVNTSVPLPECVRTEQQLQQPSQQPAPAKRKLSILEYRKRKMGSGAKSSPEVGSRTSRSRHVSPSPLPPLLEMGVASLAPLPLFVTESNEAPEEKNEKKNEDGVLKEVRWNEAPTSLEKQRENLTERLKKEFGLNLNIGDETGDKKNVKTEGAGGKGQIPEGKEEPPPPGLPHKSFAPPPSLLTPHSFMSINRPPSPPLPAPPTTRTTTPPPPLNAPPPLLPIKTLVAAAHNGNISGSGVPSPLPPPVQVRKVGLPRSGIPNGLLPTHPPPTATRIYSRSASFGAGGTDVVTAPPPLNPSYRYGASRYSVQPAQPQGRPPPPPTASTPSQSLSYKQQTSYP